ncbi:MAG: hypothetical protein F4Y70_04950 [Chloroflexi bacterium]|nr:hypothetical protein [Chloroflexota bacterium]
MEQQSEKVEGYRQPVSAALRQLGTDKSLGLPPEEITARLETHGSNALPSDQGVNWAQLILAQFTDIMVIILIVAALISALLGEEPGKHLLSQAERIPRSIAFTALAFTQMFQVMAIRAGDSSAFWQTHFKGNALMFWAVLSTFIFQLVVVYVPFFQPFFDTAALDASHILVAVLAGLLVLGFVEIEKAAFRRVWQADSTRQDVA